MTCHRMGRAPIDSMGFGTTWLTSLIRVPRPPQRMTVETGGFDMAAPTLLVTAPRAGDAASRSASRRTEQRPRRRVQGAIVPASGAREAGRVAAGTGARG